MRGFCISLVAVCHLLHISWFHSILTELPSFGVAFTVEVSSWPARQKWANISFLWSNTENILLLSHFFFWWVFFFKISFAPFFEHMVSFNKKITRRCGSPKSPTFFFFCNLQIPLLNFRGVRTKISSVVSCLSEEEEFKEGNSHSSLLCLSRSVWKHSDLPSGDLKRGWQDFHAHFSASHPYSWWE